MNKVITTPAILAAILATGCASIDHTVTRIDTEVFSVSTVAHNGANNNPGEVTKVHLRSAAQTAKASDCSYFAAIDNTAQNFTQTHQQTTGDTFVHNRDGSVQYRTAQGQQYKIVKPRVQQWMRNNTYVCFKDKPTAMLPGLIFNADLIVTN
jgi:hypothetical protein